MKNLDIEKIERKNIYKVPEDFFAGMQAKVLEETVPQKQGKIIKMKWAYSAAAAVAMMLGITFFVNKDDESAFKNTDLQAVKNVETDLQSSETAIDINPEIKDYIISETDLTNAVATNPTEKEAEKVMMAETKKETPIKKSAAAVKGSEAQVDQILASFSSADLADMGKNGEQDIYLDLYN